MIELVFVLSAILIAQVTPGPNMVAVASASLGSGRRAGLYTAIGVAFGVCLSAFVFTSGGGVFFRTYPQSLAAMKLVGGSYLIFLALKSLRGALRASSSNIVVTSLTASRWKALSIGFLIVSTNPKAALVWIAVSVYLTPLSFSLLQHALFACCVGLSALLIYAAYALLFSSPFVVAKYQRASRFMNVCFGAVFGAVGGALVLDGFKTVRG